MKSCCTSISLSYDGLRVPHVEIRRLLLRIRKLQVLQSKCLLIANNATCYFGNKQEIRLKVSWCGEPLSYTAQQVSTLTERWPRSPKARGSGSTNYPGYPQRRPCRHIESCLLALFDYPDWRFFPGFSSIVRQIPGYITQRRGTARTLPGVSD